MRIIIVIRCGSVIETNFMEYYYYENVSSRFTEFSWLRLDILNKAAMWIIFDSFIRFRGSYSLAIF